MLLYPIAVAQLEKKTGHIFQKGGFQLQLTSPTTELCGTLKPFVWDKSSYVGATYMYTYIHTCRSYIKLLQKKNLLVLEMAKKDHSVTEMLLFLFPQL